MASDASNLDVPDRAMAASFRLGLIGKVGLGCAICARTVTIRAPRRSVASIYVRSDIRLEDVQGSGSIWPSIVAFGRFAKASMSRTGRQSIKSVSSLTAKLARGKL